MSEDFFTHLEKQRSYAKAITTVEALRQTDGKSIANFPQLQYLMPNINNDCNGVRLGECDNLPPGCAR